MPVLMPTPDLAHNARFDGLPYGLTILAETAFCPQLTVPWCADAAVIRAPILAA